MNQPEQVYRVTLVAEAPTPSFESFCQEAVARTEAIGPQFRCLPGANFWPAHNGQPSRTDYRLQVWDSSKKDCSLGRNVFHVEEVSIDVCLHKLSRELAALKAKLDYDAANPSIVAPESPTANSAKGDLPF